MEKKDLKFYVSPVVEGVEMEAEGFFCASGGDFVKPGLEARETLYFEDEEE